MTTLTQFEKDKLTDCERQIFMERAEKGEELTRKELEDLRLINYGNPQFGEPSRESLSRRYMTPEEIMYELTGDASYRPVSERIGRVIGLCLGLVIWIGLPAFGMIFLWRWLHA